MTSAERTTTEAAPSTDSKKTPKTSSGVFHGLLILLVIVALAAITAVGAKLLSAPSDFSGYGQRGDFFGGFLNPILTFLTFLTLLVTLGLQRSELIESRVQFTRSADALSKQNVQSSFYQLLSTHNQLIEGMSLFDPARPEVGRVHGREVFRVIYSNLRRTHRDLQQRNKGRHAERDLIQRSYGKTYRDHQEILGHYFRYLYNTLRLLENSEDYEIYIKLLRAVLSDQELLVLYYNASASAPGENFHPLAVRHQIFDNMPAQLLEDEHATYIDAQAFGPISYQNRRRQLLKYAPDAAKEEDEVRKIPAAQASPAADTSAGRAGYYPPARTPGMKKPVGPPRRK